VRRIQPLEFRFAGVWNLVASLVVLLFLSSLSQPTGFCQSVGSLMAQQSLTLQQYISELDRCSAVLTASPVNAAALHELRLTLPASWMVTAGETRYSVRTEWLTGALAQIERNPGASGDVLAQTRLRLEAYRESAGAIETPVAPEDLAQSRARLNAILSTREFRGQRGPSWLDVLKARIWSWIIRQLERLLGRLGGSRTIGNIVAWTVILLACLLLLFWTVRFLMRAGSRSEMDLSGAVPVNRDWHRWLRDARAAAGRGDYRAAIHAAYWAAIVRMEETKSLPEDRSRTPRESLRLIQKESADYPPLVRLTERFELVWYGYRPATDADWSDAMQQLETLGCLRSSTAAISGS
jgi:Domain of unknown function (DUF4129)